MDIGSCCLFLHCWKSIVWQFIDSNSHHSKKEMRAYLTIRAKNKTIPLDHRDALLQVIHQWLGAKRMQENRPPYSFSRFEGGRNSRDGITFYNDTAFFFSAPDSELVVKLADGAKAHPNLFHGLKVSSVEVKEVPDLAKRELFYVASPLLIIPNNQVNAEYMLYNDPGADVLLKEMMTSKLAAHGIIDETFAIAFDKNYASAGIKKISYNGNIMLASWCHVLIKGKPTTKACLWDIGLGNQTRKGFGAIM